MSIFRTKKRMAMTSRNSVASNFKTRLLSVATDEQTGSQRIEVEFPTEGGTATIILDRSKLANANELKRELIGHGAFGITDYGAEAQHLAESRSLHKMTMVRRAVWKGNSFTNRFGTFGQTEGCAIIFDPTSPAYVKKVSGHAVDKERALEYLSKIDRILARSPVMMMAFLAALLPPFLVAIGDKSGFTVVLSGQSTTGKSLAARVAHSVSARADGDECLEPFNMTHGRAGEMGAYSGSLVAFKDIKASQAKQRELAQVLQTLIFGVADGSTRQRLDQPSAMSPEAIVLMISLEEPLTQFFGANGIQFQDGERVRVLEINVAPSAAGGIFDLAPNEVTKLVAETEEILSQYHGVLLPIWIRTLSLKKEKLEIMIKMV